MASVEEQLPEADPLNQEISQLKRRLTNLRRRLQIECSTILSAAATQQVIESNGLPSSSTTLLRKSSDGQLANLSTQQQAYMQQCTYRISTAVTAFKIRDPDPNAVDGGHVLGIRFEVMSAGQFLRPYYIMLNRPYAGTKHLRVHRHTIPPAVPLNGLAARHLPPAKANVASIQEQPKQNLEQFVRCLRREIMRYHNRLGVTADLRRSARLNERSRKTTGASSIVDVSMADVEAKQIRLTWADDRSGRIVIDDDGKILKFVVFAGESRDWETAQELMGNNTRIEDLATKLQDYAGG